MGKKTRPVYKLLTGDLLQNQREIETQSEGVKDKCHANRNEKVEAAIPTSDEIYLKTKS